MSKQIAFPENIQKIITLVLADANKRRESAGYSGRHDDGGGAREIENQVKFFSYGWDAAHSRSGNSIPIEWKEFEIQLDPEYEQYKKLKAKFGDR